MIVFIIMLFLMETISVNAKESYEIDENIKISKSMQSSAPDTFYMNPSDVLNDTMCSKTYPTKYWNLTNNPYTGNLIEVRANQLYTNYYFAPNSNVVMYLDYNIKPYNTEETRMNIGVYNISNGKFLKY